MEEKCNPPKKKRLSNLELLRVIAMLMVVVIHQCFYSFGAPTLADWQSSPFVILGRIGIQSLTCVCVDIFVLLSGYFGIRPNLQRLCGLLFQVWFLIIPVGLYYLLVNPNDFVYFGIDLLKRCCALGGWFVRAYLLLYLLFPILNAYIEHATQRKLFYMVLSLLIIVFVWGKEFSYGYSALFLIVLYLTGRYIRLYPCKLCRMKWYVDLGIYFACILVIIVMTILGINVKVLGFFEPSYVSPFTILGAVALLLCFSKISFYSRWVNWIAASSFAVYVLHACTPFLEFSMKPMMLQFWQESSFGGFIGKCAAFAVGLFMICVLIDKVRIYLWRKLSVLIWPPKV